MADTPVSSRAKKTPTQERSKEKVRKILESATTIIAVHGINALTTNRIAETSGVTVGSIYQYYPNKEAIVFDLFKAWLDTAYENYLEYSEKNTNETDAETFFGTQFRLLISDDDLEGKMYTQFHLAVNSSPEFHALNESHIDRMCESIMHDALRLKLSFEGVEGQRSIRFWYLTTYEAVRIVNQADPKNIESYLDQSLILIRGLVQAGTK